MCALDMGDVDTAAMAVGRGLEAQSALTHLVKPWLLAIAALVESEQESLDRASELVGEARDYAADTGLKVAEPFVAYAAGRIAALAGDVAAASQAFDTAAEGAADLGQLPLLARVHRAAVDLGRDDSAEHAAAASRAVDAIAATFEDGELRARYLSTASG